MRYATELRRWTRRVQELDGIIKQGLEEPEIAEALRELEIDPAEAGRAVRANALVFARFRTTRNWSQALVFPTFDGQSRPGRGGWVRRQPPAVRLGLAPAAVIAFFALFIAAAPRMPAAPQVIAFLGVCSAATLAVWLVKDDVTTIVHAVQLIQDPQVRNRSVLHEVVLPELRQYLDEQRAASYGTTLYVGRIHLDDVDKAPTVVTAAGTQLRRIIARTTASSIALAGHRGAGKTTTIRAVADGLFGAPYAPSPLAVVASAPSRYDARDFVLHLHAMLCSEVIRLTSALLGLSATETTHRVPISARLRQAAKWVAGFVLLPGMLAGVAILFVATPKPDFSANLQHLIDTAPGSDTRVRVGLIMTGIAIALLGGGLGPVVVKALELLTRPVILAVEDLLSDARDHRYPELSALRTTAREELQRIRFLQTYTSGWSGKVSLPFNGDVSWNKSLQRAEQHLTFPEVVANFRKFAERSAARLIAAGVIDRLVVAIDELDKIAEPAQAHEFINDVKGIFGTPNCLFLVAVSEDAMSAFERRGIPVRDAFDSAFSHMVRMDSFTLPENRRWLARRLLGVPEQFTCLVHCLSGGLPRELRRATVELVEIVQEDGRGDLEYVTAVLLDRELDRKAHAFTAAARQYDHTAELSEYIAGLVAIPAARSVTEQLKLAEQLMPRGPVTELHRVRWQSACFLLFCATVRETFVNTLDEDGLNERVDSLARARAQLAVDPLVAWQIVHDLRERYAGA